MIRLIIILALVIVGCSTAKISMEQPSVVDAEIDDLGKIYMIYSDQTIKLYPATQRKITYDENINTITSIDVSNPQKIMVYDGNLNQIVFLDNTLSEIHRMCIDQEKYLDVTAVAMSNDNNIWIWDAQSVALIKINENGRELFRTDLMTLLNIGEVDKIVEKGNSIYLQSKNHIYLFSNLGVFQNQISVQNPKSVNYYPNGKIEYLSQGVLISKAQPLFESKTQGRLPNTKDMIKYFPNKKVVITSNGVTKTN